MPDKGAGRVSDMALLTHIKAIHAETRRLRVASDLARAAATERSGW